MERKKFLFQQVGTDNTNRTERTIIENRQELNDSKISH